MFTRKKEDRERDDRDRDRDRKPAFRRSKNPRPPMLSLPRSNSIKILPGKTGHIEEETACGVMWSVSARRGRRRTNREDVYTALPFVAESSELPVSVFAIFDGHGGKRAAEYASKRLPDIFLERLGGCGDVTSSLEHAFLVTDEEVVAEFEKWQSENEDEKQGSAAGGAKRSPVNTGRKSSLFSRKSRMMEGVENRDKGLQKGCGCTATVVVMVGDKLSIAHVGDSGAVLSTKKGARRLCEDHRPSRPDEQRRIESSGGLVLEMSGIQRVNGVLAVSRSIGDAELKDFVIAKPEVQEVVLRGEEEFLVVATDGLWDVVTDEESVEIVREIFHKDLENGEELAVKSLIERAWDRGSNDDTCVLVINLVKYERARRRDIAEVAEFLSPDPNVQHASPAEFQRAPRIGEPQVPVTVEMVTPQAHVAPTPRVRKRSAW